MLLVAVLLLSCPPLLSGQDKTATITQIELSGKLAEVVANTPTGTEAGQINLQAEKGFAGIPGAPQINYIVAFLWAIWVGWIFTTVGAFGGIMASVGHLTIFGLGMYATGFKTTSPELNALLTDTIRASNQYLVGLAALISTCSFYRMKRLVVPLGLALGLGSVAGGLLISWLTVGKIQLSQYIGWFGLAVLVIGGVIFYSTTERSRFQKSKSDEAAKAFQRAMKEQGENDDQGVVFQSFSPRKIIFSFYGTEFSFNPILAVVGGMVISSISSFLGVGGGLLYVPFLTSIIGLPMYIVAGTSALAVLLSMVTSVFSYVVLKGTFISWGLVSIEMVGVAVGAFIGPKTQKYIPEKWLKWIFVVLAAYVGVQYFSKGFFGQSWLPPF
ncbi:sulfite exporter TauE/SafE family protein [Desulfobulbus sp. US5]|nr:sulfite exporter TauE/SafE family protein [Desulfobulbus sp. US4]MCW5213785.1 sulfite exporter TauE/SafE family protein [Desulfobulbus sp. US5]